MASSPVKFLFALLVFASVGWIFFVFAARLLAWFLSRILRASVEFRVAGCNCLRDVSVKFPKGAVESLSVGEVKLSLRKSLVKLGFSFISGDPKLQLLISDFEVVVRPSEGGAKKSKQSKPHKSHSGGRGKWVLVTNIARFLSISVTEISLKVPKAGIEIKDLKIDISKSGGPSPVLNVKLCVNPLLVQIYDSQSSSDQFGFDQLDSLLTGQTNSDNTEKESVPFVFENLSLSGEFGHDTEQGIKIKSLDLTSADITINLNENMLLKSKRKKEVPISADISESSTLDVTAAKKSQNDKISSLLRKPIIPDKVSFNLPKLDVKFTHLGQGLSVENNVMGIHLRCSRCTSFEDSGETAAHFDVQMDFSEIHLLREGNNSTLEILKVAVLGSVDVPIQPLQPVRAEIDVKLGGTRCNLIISRLKPWLHLQSSKKKAMVLQEDNSHKEKPQMSKTKTVMWTCTVSAPEMTIVLYDLNDLPVYHVCSQSSHLFANNIASKGIQVHAELGELHWHMADDYQECLKESLFSVEISSGSLLHIPRVSLDWGHREVESSEQHDPSKWKLIFAVDVTGMGVYFGFRHVESLILTLLSFKALLKSLPRSAKRPAQSKVGHSSKTASKGTQILKLNLDKCSINYEGDVKLEEIVVADPKRVNYGSQGGVTVIGVCPDGTPRTATVMPTVPDGCKKLKFSISVNISHLKLGVNKEKHSMQIDLERARSIYQEYSDENKPAAKVTLLDMQNAKFVRRSGGLNEVAVCSLFNVTDIAVRSEPDFLLAVSEVMTSLKLVVHNKKNQLSENEIKEELPSFQDRGSEKKVPDNPQADKHSKKKESVFAIDVEKLKISAELADGVEAAIHVQSIFSENAKIGVLLEELLLSLNDTRLFKSSRMQISRIPVSVTSNSADAKGQPITTWDCVIQSPDFLIYLPYRLELRAIDDAVEDTLRGMKLIAAAKASLNFPTKSSSKKPKTTKSTKFGSVRLLIRKLTVAIEEEPLQGWLDEHYNLMKNEVCELGVRLKFFDEFVSNSKTGGSEPTETGSERKFSYNGTEIDVSDTEVIKNLQDEIHQQAFKSYYQACQRLVLSEGSGACLSGFQSGFKLSTNRASVLTISAAELDVTLSEVEGGNIGMVEFINRVEPISLENEIPFSRMYGTNISLKAGSLSVQLRDYTYPLFSATGGKSQGCLVLAQQATLFQPQILQDLFIGRWWKVRMFRSQTGTSPPMKTYMDLPLYFDKAEMSYGVGYEPVLADISYAFTVAMRRALLGTKRNDPMANQPPKKEKSLPWWDDMRGYIHGKAGLHFRETNLYLLGTTNPYEKSDKIHIVTGCMDILQSDGHISLSTEEFKAYLSSLESLVKNCSLKIPCGYSGPFIYCPSLSVDVGIEWECDSGSPLDHYLFTPPRESKTREIILDPFRSTALSLKWKISLRPSMPAKDELPSSIGAGESAPLAGSMQASSDKLVSSLGDSPTVYLAAHDILWLFRWWNMVYLPPHKLRSFSRWPRFGVPRLVRSGNLALDKVMTEFFLCLEATPTFIKHMPLGDDDPASGLTFKTTKLKLELCYSRGKEKFTFESIRDPLDLVYQGIDLHQLKAYLNRNDGASAAQDTQTTKNSQTSRDKLITEKSTSISGCTEKCRDDGFFLDSDYFTIRRQAPKADGAKILAWQEAGRRNMEMTFVRSELEHGSDSDHGDLSDDDDGFNVVVADNCQRVFVYGLKLLWTIENRDAIWSLAGGLAKAFQPPMPSPSRQYAQRKLLEEPQIAEGDEISNDDDAVTSSPSTLQGTSSPTPPQHVEPLGTEPAHSPSKKIESSSNVVVYPGEIDDSEEDGTRHFMVNVVQPQFNLHSEDANGRFLLAAASGRILARSFHSVLHVGSEIIGQAIGTSSGSNPEVAPEMAWKRVELSVMLEQVQAHVAPTDVDPGAGLQWLPKILKSSPKVKRTGALLERVFMPCQMYFRYTRHKGGTPELKVKPLKELKFNSPNITAAMTSRQFQVMLDVLSNLLFARLPKPRKNGLLSSTGDDEDVEEEADEVVPDGVEEVELARISIEQTERERKLVLDDIRTLSVTTDTSGESASPETEEPWMITGGRSILVSKLKKELGSIQTSRKAASCALRMALQKAAQLRLMEKEKNKSPSYAMRISLRISKVVWSMLGDGKSFAETEINDMIYDFDRDYKDIGLALFTTKSVVMRNCLANAKSDMLLCPWNAPSDWGKTVMLRVNARQGAPKDGTSILDSLQVDIYPLKIHLQESMYRMMWEYFFPEEEQDSQRRQEVWKVSTTGARKGKKGTSGADTAGSSSQSTKESETKKSGAGWAASLISGGNHGDSSQGSKVPKEKGNSASASNPGLRRTSSFDRSWEETVAESVANELVLQSFTKKGGPLSSAPEYQHVDGEETSKSKTKDSKPVKSGRSSHEEKKGGKIQDDKRAKSRKMMEFHNIKISQVELLVTYEGSRFAVSDLRLLMDAFHRDDFTGTWRRLFSRVKKHIIWGVLKSVTGMQGKKFKDKTQNPKEPIATILAENDFNLSDSDGGQPGNSDQNNLTWAKRPTDAAGDGFVTSVKGLFTTQRKKAKAFVLRTMRGEGDDEFPGEWSESDVEFSPFARQLTITKAKKLIRRHTKKFRSRAQKTSGTALQQEGSNPSSPRETSPMQSDSSGGSSDEEFNE